MRTKKLHKKPDCILTSDWHLREDTPVCRLDNFEEEQWRKVLFVSDLQAKYDCDVIHAGDLFNHWKPTPYLLSKTIEHLPNRFWSIYGNHDLPQNTLDLVEKCGLYTLIASKQVQALWGGLNWGESLEDFEKPDEMYIPVANRRVLIWHVMTYTGRVWPGCEDIPAHKLLNKYPFYDLILTGHNHKSFVVERGRRLLVNPGSLTRQDADQEDYEPCVYLYYADTNTVERVPIPIEQGVITREHIERKEQRDNRIEAFVSRLNDDFETSISFEDNLEKLMQSSNVRTSVKQLVYKAIDN